MGKNFQRNKNVNNTERKTKILPKTYTRTYDASYSVCDILAQLMVISPAYADIFIPKQTKKCDTADDYLKQPISLYDANGSQLYLIDIEFDDIAIVTSSYVASTLLPQLVNKRNIHASYTVTSNHMYIKTEDKVALNIVADYHISAATHRAVIDIYTIHITTFNNDEQFIKNAEAAGYVEVQRNNIVTEDR